MRSAGRFLEPERLHEFDVFLEIPDDQFDVVYSSYHASYRLLVRGCEHSWSDRRLN